MSKNFTLGQVVRSTQGHDKDCYYLVVGFTKDKVLVADGKYKLILSPKSKNPAHLSSMGKIDPEINLKLENGQKINDQMIYHTLYKFKKSNKE